MKPRSKRLRATLGQLAFGLVTLVACSPAPMPISQSSRDPSNPNAAEGVPPAVPIVHTATAASNPHAGHDHRGGDAPSGDADAVTYVCPMHPEVTSNAPGACPKCNMKLVPKK